MYNVKLKLKFNLSLYLKRQVRKHFKGNHLNKTMYCLLKTCYEFHKRFLLSMFKYFKPCGVGKSKHVLNLGGMIL